jgi:hypothetical protein
MASTVSGDMMRIATRTAARENGRMPALSSTMRLAWESDGFGCGVVAIASWTARSIASIWRSRSQIC